METPNDEDARARLARLMDERRLSLRLNWSHVADRADVTTETLRQVRNGRYTLRPLTKTGIEQALRWERGSVDAILDGGQPEPLPEADPTGMPASAADPFMGRLGQLNLDEEDRTMVERLLADPEWAEASRRLIELGEYRGAQALHSGLDDVREEFGEQRRQRQRGIQRITKMLQAQLGRG